MRDAVDTTDVSMTKAEKIARILYGAIVRYVKAKKSLASMGKAHFSINGESAFSP